MVKTLKSYFFWTHSRGSFHYDVMVTLILAFIFITPHMWNYGDKPLPRAAVAGPITVNGDGDHGLILTLPLAEAGVSLSANEKTIRKALHQAIQPVTGDAVTVVGWQTVSDATGKPVAWKVWAHR
jgi:hypothetical protein